jgi:hypothetical protein
MNVRTVTLLGLLLRAPAAALAQDVDGYVSFMADVLPNVRVGGGDERTVAELRARALLERRFTIGERVRITAAGFADGLVADRTGTGTTTAGILRPQELHLEVTWRHADLRVGMSRVVWGRLDEFLPTDVVNPQDLSRFFLEGRSEARIPVAMVRARWLPSDRFTLEVLHIPVFRRGTFDQLDEGSSPFNLSPSGLAAIVRDEPARTWRNGQGGARASVTTGRVDWSVSAYRGFEPLPVYQLRLAAGTVPAAVPTLDAQHPRFTMLGGDVETVSGEWGVRGEVAVFVDRTLQATDAPQTVKGRALEGGIGVDRKAGAYRVSGNAILSQRWGDGTPIDRTDVSLVATVDRSFARETRTVRVFAVYNPGEQSAFARAIASFTLRDNLALEASAGWFTGDGRDALSRLATRDFAYTRLKVFF